ncbi:MAG: DNA replication protein DnaC [Clostridia bacterium]|nr:DNA replication protein DnaC [Clostridia bacterium]NCC42231.1 DNA replication protein DnaC [Clostridia bacterium]
MALRNSQYDALMRYYQKLQLSNKHDQDERIEKAYTQIPRLAQIDRDIAAISLKKARMLLGNDTGQDFDLAQQIQSLSDERTRLLTSHGFPEDYLKIQYTCPICQDTGYVNNEKCICFKKAISEHLYTQSNIRELLNTANFDAFSLDYYSNEAINEATGLTNRETALNALTKAKDFVRNFDKEFENLFLYGDTGVGKTFLSYCIAKELLDTTHSVIYYSSFDLFEAFAQNTFSNTDESQGKNDYILNCDLLIIDDLGTELTNSFVASQFFLCINERILRKKSTIISTNLTLGNFMDTYSERVFSRVSSNYTMIKLIGSDIRIQKKLLGGQ